MNNQSSEILLRPNYGQTSVKLKEPDGYTAVKSLEATNDLNQTNSWNYEIQNRNTKEIP